MYAQLLLLMWSALTHRSMSTSSRSLELRQPNEFAYDRLNRPEYADCMGIEVDASMASQMRN
jgi:hypothetical protein